MFNFHDGINCARPGLVVISGGLINDGCYVCWIYRICGKFQRVVCDGCSVDNKTCRYVGHAYICNWIYCACNDYFGYGGGEITGKSKIN